LRHLYRPLSAAGLVLVAVAGLNTVAQAHAHLLLTTPADGSILTQAPASFVFRFNEAATLTALNIQKSGEAERKQPLSGSQAATEISVPAPALAPGSYTLTYRALSADHHIVSGHIQFKVTG
jgi:methionine-rich copper-binding protein CopC